MRPSEFDCGLQSGRNLSAAVLQMITMVPWCFYRRPESRQGRLPISQLGGPRASPELPHEQAHPPAMQPDTQSDMQPEECTDVHAGMQSWQAASSNSFPDVQTGQGATTAGTISSVVQQDGTQEVHAVGGSSSSMSLVEAVALAASSPGAVVRVPTSTTLSQADQIALRYQHQVRQPAVHAQLGVKLLLCLLLYVPDA